MFLFRKNVTTMGLMLMAAMGNLSAQQDSFSFDNCCQPECSPSWFSWSDFIFTGEGLYWEVEEDNLAYIRERDDTTVTTVVGRTTTITDNRTEKLIELGSNWTGGYRLGLDYAVPCSCWDIGLVFTHIDNKKCSSKSSPNDAIRTVVGTTTTVTLASLIDTGIQFGSDALSSVSHADATWKLDFNTLDLKAGQHFAFLKCFDLHPFLGLRYLDIHQKYRIALRSQDDLSLPSNTFGYARTISHSRYWAVGFQGGFDLDWKIGCGFNLYSQVAGGLVYGRQNSREHLLQLTTVRNTIVNTTILEFSDQEALFNDKNDQCRANFDLVLGLAWTALITNCSSVTFNVGWEFHKFFDQNFFRSIGTNIGDTGGDLLLQGVTFGASYNF